MADPDAYAAANPVAAAPAAGGAAEAKKEEKKAPKIMGKESVKNSRDELLNFEEFQPNPPRGLTVSPLKRKVEIPKGSSRLKQLPLA